MLRSVAFLLALVLSLCAGARAQEGPPVAPGPPAPAAAPPDTIPLAPRASATPPPPPRPLSPAEQAVQRVRAVLLAEPALLGARGPYPPLSPPLAGVVWQQPDSLDRAVDDLLAMRRAGVRSVRTGLIDETALLAIGDLLGLAFYQDLPIVDLPAPFLLRRASEAEAALAQALALARPYASARHFGLARRSDTSDPRARAYFERLMARLRADGAPGTEGYYVTRFVRDDRCARTVDFVLLDARDADPLAMLAAWRTHHDTPAGLAGFGAGVRPGRGGGWQVPGTLAAQARHLEDALGALAGTSDPPRVAFVLRWQDGRTGDAEDGGQAEVSGLEYGLNDRDGEPRPALNVAGGFFTGSQRVFAFDAGSAPPPRREGSPLVLVGWLLALGLGVLYAGVPRFSQLAPRFFGRRDLYREAVQRGYDLTPNLTLALGAALALAGGTVGASVLHALARTDALTAASAAWPLDARLRLTGLAAHPVLLMLALTALFAGWLGLNLAWVRLLSGRRRRIRTAQALSLVVWSRWGWIVLLLGALLLPTLPARGAALLVPALLGGAALVETAASYRMLYDLSLITRVPPVRALGLGFLLPALLWLAAGLAVLGTAQAQLGFLWHLATRG